MLYSCFFCYVLFSCSDNYYFCLQWYQFDLVKEGYVNLLLVQFKWLCDFGDSVEMMQVWWVFFDVGYYQLLWDVIVEWL